MAHPAYKIIEPASSDIDTTFYLSHKQCGTDGSKEIVTLPLILSTLLFA